ncbi:unnamed protein product [Arctogadus glacialis]
MAEAERSSSWKQICLAVCKEEGRDGEEGEEEEREEDEGLPDFQDVAEAQQKVAEPRQCFISPLPAPSFSLCFLEVRLAASRDDFAAACRPPSCWDVERESRGEMEGGVLGGEDR